MKRMIMFFLLLFCSALLSCLPAQADADDGEEEFVYDSRDKRDPFLSPKLAGVKKKQLGAAQLKVEGIVREPGKPSYVIVNGEIVKLGESFAGFIVKEIQSNRVVFGKEGTADITVLLSPEEEILKDYVKKAKADIQ